ncbi:MAG: DUF5924 family protein [Kofleriaceae bacterium]
MSEPSSPPAPRPARAPTAAPPPMGPAPSAAAAPASGRRASLLRSAWWLHSAAALLIGVAAMTFARAGLRYADKVLLAMCAAWLLMFVALRFIVGPHNRKADETLTRKGVRVATNYVIKQFYQQMFFFLVPLYASSATWSLASRNWWLAPLLLVCAVASTLDLVFDNVIMERRWLASAMYGLAMFSVLNVMMPLVADTDHLTGLLVAAVVTPPAVALLSFSLRKVASPEGALLTVAAMAGLVAAVWFGRAAVPPVPLVLLDAAVGHGGPGAYECMPANKARIPAGQVEHLRCGSFVTEPGGLKEELEHRYLRDGLELYRTRAVALACDGDGEHVVLRSELPAGHLPADPRGRWQCAIYTARGQLVGLRRFEIVASDAAAPAAPGGRAGDTTLP